MRARLNNNDNNIYIYMSVKKNRPLFATRYICKLQLASYSNW